MTGKTDFSAPKTDEKRRKSSVLARKIIILCLSLTLSISIAGAVVLIRSESKNADKYMRDIALHTLRYINLDVQNAILPSQDLTNSIAAMVPQIASRDEIQRVFISTMATVPAVMDIYYGTIIPPRDGGIYVNASGWDPFERNPQWDVTIRPWFLSALQNPDKTLITESVDKISVNFEGMKSKMGKQEESAAEADNAVKNIKSLIDNMNSLIEEQSTSINNSSSAVEEMPANINSVTKALIENSRNVEKLTEASENGITGLQTVAEKIQEIAKDSEGADGNQLGHG
jgi:archaellum component FlaC